MHPPKEQQMDSKPLNNNAPINPDIQKSITEGIAGVQNSIIIRGFEFIRYEEKKNQYTWARPDEIFFVKSADHYVKSLIKCGDQLKWMSRHSTLKELLDILPADDFIRLNKFYLLNLTHFSHINEKEKLLYFKNDFIIPIPHRISPYISHLLKTTYT
jgi:DNA-binding LytR/AlgR family response regulator